MVRNTFVAIKTFLVSSGRGVVPGGGKGTTRNIRKPGMHSRSSNAPKTNIEILDHSRRRSRPIPVATPQAPAANNNRAVKAIRYLMKCSWFSGTGIPLELANKTIVPARSARTLPKITAIADAVTPGDRFTRHSRETSPEYTSQNQQKSVTRWRGKARVRYNVAFGRHGNRPLSIAIASGEGESDAVFSRSRFPRLRFPAERRGKARAANRSPICR